MTRNTMSRPHRHWYLAIVAAACCLAGAEARGQQAALSGRPPQKVYQPGEVNVEASRVYIHVYKTGLGHEHAVEGRMLRGSGTPGATENVGTLVFDMTSFDADTVEARRVIGLEGSSDESTRAKVNANMRGPDVLDVARYPQASCVVRAIRPLPAKSPRGLPQWELDCEFTLHGIARPLQMKVEVEEKNGWTHARGGFTIQQTDYGMKPYTTALGAIGVADRLDIYGDLWIAGTGLAQRNDISWR